jgi:hypothetical protein
LNPGQLGYEPSALNQAELRRCKWPVAFSEKTPSKINQKVRKIGNGLKADRRRQKAKKKMVAGAGFEPATFGL